MPETITLGRLDGEVRRALASAGIDPRHASVVLYKPLDRSHAKNRRNYAQCIPDELVFEFATATLVLDEAHRSALVAHEVGHCIAWRERGEHGEDDADEAAERVLGIPICYDKTWPGKGLQVDCRMTRQRATNPRPSKRGWPKQGTPPSDPKAYVRASELAAAYRAQYVQGDKVIASSRTKKADYPRFELGTWRIDDDFRGMYGHEIDELVLVADPRVLEPGEFDWSDPTKRLRQSGKLADMERYADWMAEGHSYPPVDVVETERGTLRITDGHRRAAAADSKGLPIKAWVSWLTDHPDPPADRDMKVGLTYELATGREFPMSKPRTANPKRRRNAPKGQPFTPAEVEEIREDIGQCVASVADRRKLSAKYDEVAASDDVVPVRMKLTRRGAQQADLFGNPRGAYRETPVAIIKRDIGRANALLSRGEAGMTRWEAMNAAAGFLAAARRRLDEYGGGSAALKRDLADAESELLHQESAWLDEDHDRRAVREDLEDMYREGFDENPRVDPTEMTDRALLDEIYELEETGGPGALQRTDAQWKRLDALLDELLARQKKGSCGTSNPMPSVGDEVKLVGHPKWWRKGDRLTYRVRSVKPKAMKPYTLDNGQVVGLGEIVLANPRRRNLQKRQLQYDGPIARARHKALLSGAITPSDSVADAGTGAYMALAGREIFHVDTDGFVYVIEYDNAAEARDDYAHLVTKFPKLMNPRRSASGLTPDQIALLRRLDDEHFGDLDWSPAFRRKVAALKKLELVRDRYVGRTRAGGIERTPKGDHVLGHSNPLRARRRNPLTWTKVGEHHDAPIYESNVVDTAWGHGVIRIDPVSKHSRGAYRLEKFGKKPAYKAVFFEIADPNEIPRAPGYWTWGSNVKPLSTPLVLEDAKRAGELWIANKSFMSDKGRIVSVTNPSPAPSRRANPAPRASLAAKKITTL